MDQVPQSSFVPRQAGNAVVQAPPRRRRRFNLLSFSAVIIFFSSLILAVAVFTLKQSRMQTLEERRTELSSKRALFNRDDIESVQLMDVRLKAATALLETHVAPSKLLEVLERTTQDQIQFNEFKFTRRPSGNVGVTMLGIAPRFNTVASQAQRYADQELFRRVIFSDLNQPEPEYVSFSVTLDIARDKISYDAARAPIAPPAEIPLEAVEIEDIEQSVPVAEAPSVPAVPTAPAVRPSPSRFDPI